jgi:phage tail sheath protein FI
MAQLKFKSAGVSTRVTNLTGPTSIQPAGIPAGVIGVSQKGPAFVPTTLATQQDFVVTFGEATDNKANAPLAALEWLRNAQSLTFLRTLGAGAGLQRESTGTNSGRVRNAGFVVGSQLPQRPGGGLGNNPYAALGGHEGRTFVLGCYMKESAGSTLFQDAGKPTAGVPLVRGVLMAPSGVYLTLSSSRATNNTPAVTGSSANATGATTGSVDISEGRQEFVLLLNGHLGSDPAFPNALTASFDPTAPNYITKIFNTDPLKIEQAGHYLYADWKVHTSLAVPSGSSIINAAFGAGAVSGSTKTEDIAFLLTSALTRNSGSTTVPNFENFEDRYQTAETVWVTSQQFGGSEENLFKISSLDDGAYPNEKLKFSIENIIPGTTNNPYGKFDLIVRDFYDTDKNQVVLEAFRGVDLNPESSNYIARRVGDYKTFYNFDAALGKQKLVTTGLYPNNSRYIRVEMATKVENSQVDDSAVPFGFRGAPHLMTSGSAPMPNHTDSTYLAKANPFDDLVQIPVPFRQNVSKGAGVNRTTDKALYWGVQFEEKTSATEPNASTTFETNMKSYVKYFPGFHTTYQNVAAADNNGTADTAENGIIDADRFNNNKFSLGNIEILENSAGNPDVNNLASWRYVRSGQVTTTGSYRALTVSDLEDSATRNIAKFSFFIHGGFDGTNMFDREMANLTNECIAEEMNYASRGINEGPTVSAFNKALDVVEDATEVDVQIITIPGIRHSIITDRALMVTQDRFDALYIMDIDQYDTTNTLVTSSNQVVSVRYTANNFSDRGINNSFGAAYFPDVVLRDEITGKTRTVPPSVAVLGAFAKNDAIGFPWFAPAGFTRGALETVENASVLLSRDNMDALQDVKVNPIVSFPGSEGNVIWGQRTLLDSQSALERVNVRRLLIDIRRKVKAVANRMLFEPGRDETLVRFTQLVNPILKKVQDQKGLDNYLVKIDTTTTTDADIENKTIRGKIYVVPTKTLEFLDVDFVVTNRG